MNISVILIDFEGVTPKGRSQVPIEVAAQRMSLPEGSVELSRSELMSLPEGVCMTAFDTHQTGITPTDVRNARPANAILAELDEQFGQYGDPLVAHNASVERLLLRNHRNACPRLADSPFVDTIRLAKAALPNASSYRLSAVAHLLGLPTPTTRHRALADVELLRLVLLELVLLLFGRDGLSRDEFIRIGGLQSQPEGQEQLF